MFSRFQTLPDFKLPLSCLAADCCLSSPASRSHWLSPWRPSLHSTCTELPTSCLRCWFPWASAASSDGPETDPSGCPAASSALSLCLQGVSGGRCSDEEGVLMDRLPPEPVMFTFIVLEAEQLGGVREVQFVSVFMSGFWVRGQGSGCGTSSEVRKPKVQINSSEPELKHILLFRVADGPTPYWPLKNLQRVKG